jgi:hypothetical protein
MGLLDACGGPDRIFGQEGAVKIGIEPSFARHTDPLQNSPFRKIVSRWAAYINSPPEWCRKRAAVYFFSRTTDCRLCGLFFSPTTTSACADSGLRKVSESTVNRALPFSFTVTSRRSRDARINQRIDSLPCPALFSMFPGRQARFLHGRGFHQTKTIGLRRLELRLDYAGGGGEGRVGKSGSD